MDVCIHRGNYSAGKYTIDINLADPGGKSVAMSTGDRICAAWKYRASAVLASVLSLASGNHAPDRIPGNDGLQRTSVWTDFVCSAGILRGACKDMEGRTMGFAGCYAWCGKSGSTGIAV